MRTAVACLYGLLTLAARDHAPPRVSVHVERAQGAGPVAVTIRSDGATVEAGSRRLSHAGDVVVIQAPADIVADLAGGGLTLSSPADTTWIKVDVSKPGESPSLSAAASAAQIRFDGGRVWLRGVKRPTSPGP